MPQQPVYLDYAATTPLDERVLAAMMPYFTDKFGNTSSLHSFGQAAEGALETARERVAAGLNCTHPEVVFTACGSESDNLALRGAAFYRRECCQGDHILISAVEHPAVTRTAAQLSYDHGFEIEYLPVDETGRVDPAEVAARLRPNTAIVSVMYANNEVGSLNPIAEIGAICKEREVPFHTDAVQAAAYLPVDVEALNVDYLSLGGHKFNGPKGVGALYIREGAPFTSTMTGGGQEAGRRAGTHNTAYIVGFAEAFALAISERETRTAHVKGLRDGLIRKVLESVPQSRLTGHNEERMPNHASFAFHEVDGNALLIALDIEGFACSSGSACKTGNPEPSGVLQAMGLASEWALGSLRVTLGSKTDAAGVDAFTKMLPPIIERLRALS